MSIDAAALELIHECVQRKNLVFFSSSGVGIVFQTNIAYIKNQAIYLTNTVPPEHISAIVKSKQFFLKIHSVRFTSDLIETDGVRIIFPLSALRLIEDSRSSQRLMFDAHEKVYLEVTNPIDQQTLLKKNIIDMSATGLSIRTPLQSKLYTPGQRFEKMRIYMDNKVHSEVDGYVVYQQIFLSAKGKSYCQVGFKFGNAP